MENLGGADTKLIIDKLILSLPCVSEEYSLAKPSLNGHGLRDEPRGYFQGQTAIVCAFTTSRQVLVAPPFLVTATNILSFTGWHANLDKYHDVV